MQIQKSQVREIIESVAIAGVLAFFLITFVIQSFVVEGQSMEPTLHDGERLFVNKFIYRFREPQRGEVIVFSPRGEARKKYIKRVIGLPGDQIIVDSTGVRINGEFIDEPYIADLARYGYDTYEVPENQLFVLGDNRNHSSDSRNQRMVGYVDFKSVSGRAFLVYWPITKIKLLRHPDYHLPLEE